MTDDELEVLKEPPRSLHWWNANGPIAQLLSAGLLTYKTRQRNIPAHTLNYTDFERTPAGDQALSEKTGEPK